MIAGLRSQRIATTRLALPPTALAVLVGVALLVGGLLGVAAKSELDTIAEAPVTAPVTASSLEVRLLTTRAHLLVGRGPLVRDAGATGSRPGATVHVTEHAGSSGAVATSHALGHGPLR